MKEADPRLLVRLRRPDGKVTTVRVPEEHLQRVMDLANGQFGDKSIVLGGPKLALVEKPGKG